MSESLQPNFSASPYFDDYDADKDYTKILFKPGLAVQTRELNQLQTILQEQISNFASQSYRDGDVVTGCAITYDANYDYVILNSNYANGSPIANLASYEDSYVVNPNGLKAVVVETLDTSVNTFYIKYLNTVLFGNGSPQTVFSSNDNLTVIQDAVNVAIVVANTTGIGYSLSVDSGIIFKNGMFVAASPEQVIVTPYSNSPNNISVGFTVTPTVITALQDNSLYDNAAGALNYKAPGADRLQMTTVLTVQNTAPFNNNPTFFPLVNFENGLPIEVSSVSLVEAAIEKQMATRTYETNGNYVVNPFKMTTQNKLNSDPESNTFLNLVISPGVGYVKGSRVDFINNTTVNLEKALTEEVVVNNTININYGYYVECDQFAGDFGEDTLSIVELHNVPQNALQTQQPNQDVGPVAYVKENYTTSTLIGYAYCRMVQYVSGDLSGLVNTDAIFNIYLSNIQMLPGFNFSQVKSLIGFANGGTPGVWDNVTSTADVVLTLNPTTSLYEAVIQNSGDEIMVFPFGQKSIDPAGFSNTGYVYKAYYPLTFNSSNTSGGNMTATISINPPVGSGSEIFYNTGDINDISVSPNERVYCENANGTVNIASSSAVVIGDANTRFMSDYFINDYIAFGQSPNPFPYTRRIVNISNNSYMVVDYELPATESGWNHQKVFPTGILIDFTKGSRSLTISNNSITFNVDESITGAASGYAYVNVLRSNTIPISKQINRGSLISIDVANNVGGTQGPWCLGVPDVYQLNHVYVGSGTYSNTNPDLVSLFTLDNGQRDSYYGLATLSSKIPLSNTATLLVSVDNFSMNPTSQGVGFFTANSYPIDANTANTAAITLYEIPKYVSTDGTTSDLRDCVDFRPYMVNTAVANTTNSASATINPVANTVLYVKANTSYLPVIGTPFNSVVTHFLPRKDRIALTSAGDIIITQGIPSNNPVVPNEISGTMTIGIATVPGYPTLTPAVAASYDRYDYAVQIDTQQTKRFTMSNIKTIADRINTIESYTALNIVEQAATNLPIKSNLTGLDRFKNGILVDPFKDHTIGNTLNPSYKASIDPIRSELRPYFTQLRIKLDYDTVNSSNTVQTGDLITLDYTPVEYQTQPSASMTINCVSGDIYNFNGSLVLTPFVGVDVDTTVNPDVIANVNDLQNWVNIPKNAPTAWGTEWQDWTLLNPEKSDVSRQTNYDGTISNVFENQIVPDVGQQIQALTSKISSQSTHSININTNYSLETSYIPYVKSVPVFYQAQGMRPSSPLYAYFDGVPVGNSCYSLTPYSGSVTSNNGVSLSANSKYVYIDTSNNKYEYVGAGYPLYADANGNVWGVFLIPENSFVVGAQQFVLSDSANLQSGVYTTQASATYISDPQYIYQNQDDLQATPSLSNWQDILNQKYIQQITINSGTYQPPSTPVIVPDVIPATSSGSSYDGQIGVYGPLNFLTESI